MACETIPAADSLWSRPVAKRVIAGTLLAAVAIAVYLNSLPNPLVFDDIPVLYDVSRRAHKGWSVCPAYTRWLTYFSFRLTYAAGRMDPAVHRLGNICLHAASTLLLFGLVRRSLLMPVLGERFRDSACPIAAAVASLWAVHPMQTETVAYVAQRFEGLMGFFFLLTLYCFARAPDSARPRVWHDAGIAACLLGMGAKEVMVAAPPVVLLYDRLLVAGSFRSAFRQRWAVHAAHFAALLAQPVMMLASQGGAMAAGYGSLVSGTGWREYLRSQSAVILHYLRLSFFPHPLCLDYGWKVAADWSGTALPFIAVAAIFLAAMAGLFSGAPLAFPLLAFFAILAPTSSFHPLPDIIAEHRMYLPLAAVISLAVIGVERFLARFLNRRLFVPAGVFLWLACLAVLAAATLSRNMDYRSEEILWKSALQVNPANVRARFGLGAALATQGRLDEARTILDSVLSSLPPAPCGPADPDVETLRASAHNVLGSVFQRRGDLEVAERHFRAALAAVPRFSSARTNLGLVLYLQGRRDEAEKEWRHVIETDRTAGALAYRGLAGLALESGDPRVAVELLEKAVEAEPACVEARRDLAWLLAVSKDAALRNGRRALENAMEADRAAGHRDPLVLDVLGAAYAECGDYESAVKLASKALDLLPDDAGQLRSVIAGHIERYMKREPVRE